MRWEAGHCRFGDRCNFAHGEEQLRQLPPRTGGGRGRGRGGEGGYREEGGGGRGGGRGQGGYGRGGAGRGLANGQTPEAQQQQQPPQQQQRRQQQEDPTWRAAGCPVAGPQGWTQYRTEGNEVYYHNAKSQETTWDPPDCWKNPPAID
ncbi:hypothetical protein ABPG75_005040 [Micractinium tetrahymenae]